MGKDTRKKILDIKKEQVLELYEAGPDAVVSFILHIQDLLNNLGLKVESQQKIIEQLERRIQELEAIIKKDSHNSSKPPSSDGYRKRPVKQEKKISGEIKYLQLFELHFYWNVLFLIPAIFHPLSLCSCHFDSQ